MTEITYKIMNCVPYQLCPKCGGDGDLMRYNSPALTTGIPICDVCNGSKIIPMCITQEYTEVIPTAESLKEKRIEFNLSMQDVADKTGVSKATISRIERGFEAEYRNVKKLWDYYREVNSQ